MILFFDRNVGNRLPKLLTELGIPVEVKYHQQCFAMDTPDDVWLAEIGRKGWILVGHDSKFQRMPNELAAIIQHQVGCFYLSGSRATLWNKLRMFCIGFEKLVKVAEATEKPFIFTVEETRLVRRQIPHIFEPAVSSPREGVAASDQD